MSDTQQADRSPEEVAQARYILEAQHKIVMGLSKGEMRQGARMLHEIGLELTRPMIRRFLSDAAGRPERAA